MDHDTYVTTKGVRRRIYRPNGKLVSARAKFFANRSKLIRGVSKVFIYGGFVVDGVGLYNYYYNPSSSFVVSPTKAGINTLMVSVGLYGGFPGMIVSGGYFLIDGTIGWGNATQSLETVTEKNLAILGPGWSPFRMEGGMK